MYCLAYAFSPLHPVPGLDPAGAVCAVLVGLWGIVYASRLILHPDAHLERMRGWLSRLEGGYHNHLPQARREAKIMALRIRLSAPDAIKRTKRMGYLIIAFILLFELMVWGRVLLGSITG